MKVVDITRVFKYNGVTLPDPSPSLGPDQVREFYSTQYGELLNSVVEGPVTKGDTATYTFTRAAGSKGAARPALQPAADLIKQAFAGQANRLTIESLLAQAEGGQQGRAAALIADVVRRASTTSPPMTMPAQAFGIWG